MALQLIGVNGIGADDEMGLKFPKQFSDCSFGVLEEKEGFGKILSIGGMVDHRPERGNVSGDFPVGLAEEGINFGASEVAGISDFDIGLVLQSLGEVPGGTVMPVAEASRED